MPHGEFSAPVKRTCPNCGKDFETARASRLYCFECSPVSGATGTAYNGRGRSKTEECVKCGVKFKTKGSRKRCWKCHPPAVGKAVSVPRKDGLVAGAGIPQAGRPRDERAGHTFSEGLKEPARELDGKAEEVARLEAELRATGTHADCVKRNPGGDWVAMLPGRPPDGWGKCRHVDPETRVEPCDKERFRDVTAFCHEHMVWWREKRLELQAKKVVEEEVSGFGDMKEGDFAFETPKEAKAFLAKVNFAVYKNWIPIGKARALSEMARWQLRAMETEAYLVRLAQMAKARMVEGGDIPEPMDEKELVENLELLKEMGLNGAGGSGDDGDMGKNGAEVGGS